MAEQLARIVLMSFAFVLKQDFTIGYPGIPPAGYGQSFYTLRKSSIALSAVPRSTH